MLWMYWPNVDENCLMVDGGIGAPPDQILLSDFNASGSAFGAFISAMNTVIDPTVNVGWCSLMTSMPSDGSNRWNSTSGAPRNSAVVTCAISPVMWKSGATPRITSLPDSPHHSR